MARFTPYLRWIKSIQRRALQDLEWELCRQQWWHNGVSIASSAIIRSGPNSQLEIGTGSMIGPYTLLDLQNDPLLQETITSRLIIGNRTAINEFNNIRAANGEILIGNDCLIAQFVSIIAANHSTSMDRPMRAQPADLSANRVAIGDDVWIGANAVILPGVTIGTGSVIAAGAVVTRDIPEYVVATGVPAVVRRERGLAGNR